MTTYKKKLIEVALPLEEINKESAREKSIRHGHPSTLHLWWARRPLAACRSVLFSQLVDDPDQEGLNPDYLKLIDKLSIGKYEGQAKTEAEERRFKLFAFIEELVKWENIKNEKLFNQAFELINASCDGNPPPIYDPFCGGGSIPLEAQRLGLEAYGSDLNPVAVMISKALVEIPPKFAGQPPINPEAQQEMKDNPKLIKKEWKGAEGLAEDVKYYGKWMRDEAFKRIGHLYPQVELEDGTKANVIAWLWARTVPSPNPAVSGIHVPLVKSFALSVKKGKEVYIKPIIDNQKQTYSFKVMNGIEEAPESTVNRQGARCLLSNTPITFEYIREQGKLGMLGNKLLAIVAEGSKGRYYLSPIEEHEKLAEIADTVWKPEVEIEHWQGCTNCVIYGLEKFSDLFTDRQALVLNELSKLINNNGLDNEIYSLCNKNAVEAGYDNTKAKEYARIISFYLAFGIDKLADRQSNISSWDSSRDTIRNTFGRQAIPMTWDYAEGNPFSDSSGNFLSCVEWIWKALENAPAKSSGIIRQSTAQKALINTVQKVISTDPPYFDNVPYSNLSDFFYVWLRKNLKDLFQEDFSTVIVPREAELVANKARHGSKQKAEKFFMDGMLNAMKNIQSQQLEEFPVTIYYAFKQSEIKEEGISSTGWATFLEAVINSGMTINGTWPMRTELSNRMMGKDMNALASSIVLVCRKQPKDLPVTTRGDFIKALKRGLPKALEELKKGNIAPVDMAQSSIGPGMAIFTKYSKVMESDGSAMTVKTALQIINESLDEYLAEQEGDYDTDTRFAITWFEQHGMKEGNYGDAETLANARNVSVQGVVDAGILTAKAGKVRLIPRNEMPADWDPTTDDRLTVWEATQHLIRVYQSQGESAAAEMINKLGSMAETAKDLSYRLYSVCERKKWADEALAYNGLVIAWPNLVERASQLKKPTEKKEPKKTEDQQMKLEV